MADSKKYVRALLGKRSISFSEKINLIKANVDPSDYKEALKMHPSFSHLLNQRLFFEKPEDIKQREVFNYTHDFKREYRWITLLIEENLGLINEFASLKNEFEKFVIKGEYLDAKSVLEKIETKFGITLWSLQANLLIEELLSGTEANWNRLSYYLNKINNVFYEFLINTTSKRVESNLSYEAFFAQFQNDIDNAYAGSIVTDFFVFKNASVANYDYSSKTLMSVIYVAGIFGVIDQYLTLIDVISYHALDPDFNTSIFSSFLSKAGRVITNDPTLNNLCNIIVPNRDMNQPAESSTVIRCLDFYYAGQFDEALKLAEQGINETPLEFEFYEVYCKSLINLGISRSLPETSIGDIILNNLQELLNFRESYDFCIHRLLKLSLLLMNFGFGKQLYQIIFEIEGAIKSKHSKIGALYATYTSNKILEKGKLPTGTLKKFENLLHHQCYRVAWFKSGMNIESQELTSNSGVQLKMINAQHYFNKAEYTSAIQILNSSEELDKLNYYLERKLNLLFDSYLSIHEYNEALNVFSKVVFNKELTSKKINYHYLYECLKSVQARKDIHSIYIPILFAFVVKEYDLFDVYDEFMEQEGYLNIEEIDVEKMILHHSFDEVIYFLNKVATIDTLKYSTDYTSINDVEEARIKILKSLILINSDAKIAYEDEINDIYRVNSVRKVLKEVDEGRLYIDVNALKSLQIKSFNNDYKRFKEIELLSANQNLIGFNSSSVRNWDPNISTDEVVNTYNSANYLAFKNIYLELRDNFLFSKEYGLDSCLSTRIRHGALKNHIRSVFEKLDLVTSKTKEGYLDNNVWYSALLAYPETNSRVQSRLKQFSSEIDEYTAFIVDKLIQIKTEKIADKPDALFQYNTHDELLFSFYSSAKSRFDSIETMVDILLSDLVNYTLINVGNDLSAAFTNSIIAKKFKDIIEALLSDLRMENLPYRCDLISNVMKSTTEIQNELEYLSEWFYLNTTSPSTLLSMETILNASLNLTNRINPLFNLSPSINIKQDFAGYSSLIFVFNILLNNVITHSNLENDEINLNIDVSISEGERYAFITFRNNLRPGCSYSANRQKLEEVKNNWNNHQNIERSNKEGESGYDKIKRMLIYETFTKTDKFEYVLENDSIAVTLFFPYQKPKSND